MASNKFMVDLNYLEDIDINADGSLKAHVCKNKPVVMMIQGNFCGYCTQAKPAFQQLAREMPSVTVVTVQTDGGPSDKRAAQMLSSVNKSPGVPAFLGFDREGRFVKMHGGGRDVDSLKNFARSL